MKMIEEPRTEDSLETFGTLLRFAALVYENDGEGEANAPFAPINIDGDVAFPKDRASADAAFDAWVVALGAAEEQFLEEGEEEGFVALLQTPKGLMLLAGTTLMGFEGPDLDALLPDVDRYEGMPHVSWERILLDVFEEG